MCSVLTVWGQLLFLLPLTLVREAVNLEHGGWEPRKVLPLPSMRTFNTTPCVLVSMRSDGKEPAREWFEDLFLLFRSEAKHQALLSACLVQIMVCQLTPGKQCGQHGRKSGQPLKMQIAVQ